MAQTAPPLKAAYTFVDQPPQLPGNGGTPGVMAAMPQQLVYPSRAVRDGLSDRVFINLTVASDGSISDAKVVRGLRPGCDPAILAAVQRLPHLSPPRQHGRPVYFNSTLPVSFQPPAPASTH